MKLDPAKIRVRHDTQVKMMMKKGPVAVIVLGGAHDLSGSVHRHDGVQGVELAEAFRPDLIVLDIGLPKLNGYDACRRIREQPWAKDILIVAATGWGQDEDRRHSKEAGFDHHLVKPVDAAEINRLLAERKA